MNAKIASSQKATFGGRQFKKERILEIQKIVRLCANLSRRELAHTICEHLQWITPTGTDKIQTCLNALEEMEACGLIRLPSVRTYKSSKQKALSHTSKTSPAATLQCRVQDLMPIQLVLVTETEEIKEWNEFIDRYHYLGYRRPIGTHLRYYAIDRQGRKLGCLLFCFATTTLKCRDEWVGWTKMHRQKRLNLVIKNARFLIFPWVEVPHLASKALAYAMQRVANDWVTHHGYQPVLVETFIDPQKYEGTCYKAANWVYIGDSKSKKHVYLYPLHPDAREILTENTQPAVKKVKSNKVISLSAEHSVVYLWHKLMTAVTQVADAFDEKWQRRKRILSTLLIILFIFRLVFSKNHQGYGATVTELWEYCRQYDIPLPQEKPVCPAALCQARKKVDESLFKEIHKKILETVHMDPEQIAWKGHRLFAVDGTRINLPRELLKAGYPQVSHLTYYPQGLVSCVYQLKSQIPYHFDLAMHQSERLMALEHLKHLQENDCVIYDRGYFSYVLLHQHIQKNIPVVFRLGTSTYKSILAFIKGDKMEEVVTIWPSRHTRRNILKTYPDFQFSPLTLRLVKYHIHDTTYTLGTTLLDAIHYSRESLADLYHARWGIEELYKISKTLIDVEDFHGKTERGVKQELFAHFVILTLTRMFAHCSDDILQMKIESKNSRTIKTNMKNCLLTVARNLENLFLRHRIFIKKTLCTVMQSITNCYQAVRDNRSYKRVSHKPYKKWMPQKKKPTAIPATI